jgi:hypothetical protein
MRPTLGDALPLTLQRRYGRGEADAVGVLELEERGEGDAELVAGAAAAVASRKLSASRSPSNRPSTVCVLPTSTAEAGASERVVVRRESLARRRRKRLCGQLGIIVLAARSSA